MSGFQRQPPKTKKKLLYIVFLRKIWINIVNINQIIITLIIITLIKPKLKFLKLKIRINKLLLYIPLDTYIMLYISKKNKDINQKQKKFEKLILR